MRKTINIDRLYFVLLLYFFLFIQSYSTLIKNMIGGPSLVLINFFFLMVIGLLIEKPNCLQKLPRVGFKHLKYLFLLIVLFNFRQMLFGNYFGLFGKSYAFIFILLTPFLVLIKPKWASLLAITLTLTITLIVIINKFPLNHAGNMLSYINASLDILLSGRNPYLEEVNVIGYTYSRLGYAPLLVLPYLPFRIVELDIRCLSLISVILFVLFYYITTRNDINDDSWKTCTLAFMSLITAPYVYLLITTKHIFFYGLLVYLLIYYMKNDSHYLKSILLAFIILTRQFTMILAFPVVLAKPKRMVQNIFVVALTVAIVLSPFAFQNPIGTIQSMSATKLSNIYNVSEVEFGSRFSPGGGSAFNIGHLIKYLYPEWSVKSNIFVIVILSLIIVLFLLFSKINRITGVYFCYLVFLAFAWNFSQYFFWGIFCIAWATVFGHMKYSKDL